MGLQIQFIDRRGGTRSLVPPAGPSGPKRFELREDGSDWIAPEVNLVPVNGLPAILRVEFHISGSPDVVAARLRAAYPPRKFPKPVTLSEPEAVASGRVANANPLPRQVLCEFLVTAVYRDMDTRGTPTGAERTVTDTCLLYTGSAPDRPPELALRNRELTSQVGLKTSQNVVVRQPRGPAPVLRLIHPDSVVAPDDPILERLRPSLPALRKAIEDALAASPVRTELGPAAEEWMFPLLVRLGQAEKNALAELQGALAVPCAVTLDGAKGLRWALRLELPGQSFGGWVVVDFGTTNSTVTVHDTLDRVEPVGLPVEQEQRLRVLWVEWLKRDAAEALPPYGRQFEVEWKKLRAQTARALNLSEELTAWLTADSGPGLYAAIAQLEANLRLCQEPFRRAVYVRLDAMASEALRVPTLRRYQLFPMKIELDQKTETVASDLEITAVEVRGQADDRWPVIRMGKQAVQGRLAAIGRTEGVPLDRVMSRFHPSPKRYFGTDKEAFPVTIEARNELVSYDQLMRAGWSQLLAFARRAMDDEGGFNEGAFRKVVITYPTVAPPSVRQTIQRLLKDLRIADVQTDYDEAVASAIFYVMREYSTYPELGLESFKARARLKDKAGNPYQNVLVFDIGGGTTDVALLSLTMSEETVFGPGEDRGAGGRYYKLTPKLLRATGHMQLGGELMTLRVFLLLKAMIADRLLALVQDGKLTCDPIRAILDTQLPDLARNPDTKKYRAGWLRDSVEQEPQEPRSDPLKKAHNLAEQVVPTRWSEGAEDRAARLQAFYTLWELAEGAKKQLGGKRPGMDDDAPREPYVVKADKVKELLSPLYETLPTASGASLEVRVTQAQVQKVIAKVVEEAVKIALGALESLPPGEMVDWLILSGQSCNLVLVDREIRQQFRESNKFIWNPERVTFLPQYAKLSTSIGACYAENQRRYRVSPSSSKQSLRRGLNTLYFDIDNLFSYLPCSLLRQLPDGPPEPVFLAGRELLDLYGEDGDDQRALARSEWAGLPLEIMLYRRDYDGGRATPWCGFNGKGLATDIGLTDNQWRDQIRVMYEIDHRLNVDLLVFRTDAAHPVPDLALSGRESVPLNVGMALGKAAERRARADAKEQPATPPVAWPAIFDADGQLAWRLGVGDASQVRQWLFEPGQKLNGIFHLAREAGTMIRTCLSRACVEAFNEENSVVVWATLPDGREQVALGKIERPGDRPNFQRRYRFSLDEQGMLRAHPGEPAFWMSDDPTCLRREPGRVLRRATIPAKRETDEDRNPFTGRH